MTLTPVPLCAMTLSVLIAICLFACAFYLFVLFQWMRDKKHAPKSQPAIGDESGKGNHKKRLRYFSSQGPQESVIGAPSNRVGQDSDPAVRNPFGRMNVDHLGSAVGQSPCLVQKTAYNWVYLELQTGCS